MFARVASFEGVDSARASETLEEAEAIGRPLIEQLPGYLGNLELAVENGKVLLGGIHGESPSKSKVRQILGRSLGSPATGAKSMPRG